MKKIRILIADDHAFLRVGLTSYIAGKNDMECVGEADNGRTAVELARKLKPDVIVMDLMMPELNGAEATRLIHDEWPDIRIIVLTSYGSSREMSQAIANGATDALLKDTPTEDLITAIRKSMSDERPAPESPPLKFHASKMAYRLSRRQSEILAALCHGLSNDEIGKLLGISGETVKKHLSIVFAKIGAANRAEAVSIAHSQHLVSV